MTVTTRPPRTATRPAAAPAPLIAPPPGELSIGAARGLPLRREGPAKLTGTALYTDDLVFPGAWYGHTIRSTEAHARLLGIGLDPDFDWSKVVVLTARDIPGENIVSLIADDQPILVEDEIRHQAEPVALLAAPDRATLNAAKGRVRLKTEPLPAVFDPREATQEFAHFNLAQGDVQAGLAAAEVVIEGEYRVGHQEQLYIENNAMIAVPRADGGVTIHGSMQCPYYVHKAMKRALKLSAEQAVIVQAETGGGFGGKEEYPSIIAIHAALLAQRVGKPVRMIYDRHEDLAATTKRHPAIIRSRWGVSRDGVLLAQDIEVLMDGGAYSTLTPVVLSRGTLHAGGPYACPNVRIRGRAVATNTPPNGAFRGFGAPQTEFAAEMQVNRIADALGVSPLDLRRQWVYRAGDETPSGQLLRDSLAGEEVLERAAEAAEFERIRAQAAAREQRTAGARAAHGIGIALAWHGAGFTGSGEVKLASVASVELTDDGRIRVLTASTEMGQGTKTIFPQLVAERLSVPIEAVEMAPQDTSIVPDSGPTVASRTAMVVGGLVIRAAERLREQVEAATGRPFADSYADYARQRGGLRIDQQFEPYPGVVFDDETYRGDAYPAYGWACAVAEVEVDLDTGEVAVRSVVSADDVGKAIHPVLAEGQVEGGTLQAVGYATIEEIKLEDGRYLNDRLATYLIPTSLDAPRIEAILVEQPFAGAPHGAKGVGELPMDVAAPAVVAAIHDATGAWIHDLPATPERVLAALAGIAPPALPGISSIRRQPAGEAAEANLAAPAEGTDPEPDRPSDPQPMRGPSDQ
ncbi:MAG TPA: xanthine dehydrogenase family protein molybdopterin-binding subunit [Candidatus Limnocylindria bacterium]|jgi:CO/xanthine dehydrogenase Mo-binding subunit|nr:xanthine dehydrogenase family protein molybdopterin-binding subunit [Candidatus Limnocylindria bacterium]